MFLLFRKEDGGKMFLFLTFCEVFFFCNLLPYIAADDKPGIF